MIARGFLCALVLLLLPVYASAATIEAGESLELSEAPAHNAYLAGGDVRVTVALPADLLAAAAALQVLAPVMGDIAAIGSTVNIEAPVSGDVRIAGGHISIRDVVAGDIAAFGGFIRIEKEAREIYAAGGTVELTGGARGPVTVYAGTVSLAGTYAGDVHIAASNKLTIAPGTVIQGVLEYNAPEEASLDETVVVSGGVRYVGSASFLPTAEEAQAFALAGIGVFLIVRLIAGMVTAGLVAGLFPSFSAALTERVLGRGIRGFARAAIIGLLVMVLTPLLAILLLMSFVGMGVAFLIALLYLLAVALSFVFAAVIAGGALARSLWKRSTIEWKDAVLGMLLLYLVALLPGIGGFISFILSCVALGALSSMTYQFLFKRKEA